MADPPFAVAPNFNLGPRWSSNKPSGRHCRPTDIAWIDPVPSVDSWQVASPGPNITSVADEIRPAVAQRVLKFRVEAAEIEEKRHVRRQVVAPPEPRDVSEAQIAVHWPEEAYVPPPNQFIAQANLTDAGIFERFALDKFPECFKEFADLLDWYKYWETTLDASNPPFWRWFVGGKINACHNCVDRHIARHKNKTAIHFVPEPENEAVQHLTYQELFVRVNELAALLRDFCGLKAGDRVTLHMPMVAELPITMLACARLGVIHSQVFSGFSGKACGRPHLGFREPRVDHDGRLLPRRPAARSQGKGRHRGHRGRRGRPPGRQGSDLAALPGQVLEPHQARGGARLHHQRPAGEVPRPAGRARADAGRGAAFPHVHERHHGAAQRLPALHRRLPRLRHLDVEAHPGHPSRGRVLVHGGHRLDHRPFLHRLRPAGAGRFIGRVRRRADPSGRRDGRGASRKTSASTSSTRRRRRSARCGATDPTSLRSTATTSST